MTADAPMRTTHLADAADALGLPFGAGSGLIWAGALEAGASGRAFTVLQGVVPPGGSLESDAPTHAEVAMTLAQPGDIIVIAIDGASDGATWGEAHALRAFNRGVTGVLLDGNTRDAGTLAAMALPVLYRGTSPLKSTGRLRTIAINAEVRIGGVPVRNGDHVALDADGFVVLSAEVAPAVLARAQEIANAEEARNATLLASR